MEENENIHDKLQELFGKDPGNFNILQRQIDVDLQMKYFDLSRKVKDELDVEEVLNQSENLFEDEISEEEKKDLLAKLASIEDVKAFRIIEEFYADAPESLAEWTALAYQESRMLIESRLLDQNQVLISTGLGGKGEKLRYFVVLLGRTDNYLTDLQKKVIKSEFHYILNKHDSEIEAVNFSESMATIKAVIPMKEPVKAVFEEAVVECNNYGNFLKDNFIITNVKELSFREIKDFLKNKDYIIRDPDDE